jgi:maltooligosyltrehalose trehalohydrolase
MSEERITETEPTSIPEVSVRQIDLGALLLDRGATRFRVWAPKTTGLSVSVISDGKIRVVRLLGEGNGYFTATIEGIGEGARYFYQFDDGTERPDPASRFQPEGVHGPSQVVNPAGYAWTDDGWRGIALDRFIVYELHVGTFTGEGTFDSVIPHLDYLVDLGVTAVELMPVAQFPGERNWGYDGVYPFAPQNSYGGPEGLKRLVDACHDKGLAVILDVVYNHLGPEGNYLGCFGYYFTDRYRTPWGEAVNFDGPYSDEVRNYFIANALFWIDEYHLDALRLDAVHGIYDFSALHILQELTEAVHRKGAELDRRVHVIAESDLNDVRLIKPTASGGYGMDAQWSDDFHHALHNLLTGERSGYYADFGGFSDLVKGFRNGFVVDGSYSGYRKRRHGSSSADISPGKLLVFSQNHDQVGNRMMGERLSATLTTQQLMLAAAIVLLSPYVPLLFMGEEYAETAPFPYFVNHGDKDLIEAVRQGRLREFADFGSQGTPPDPQAAETFLSAKLDREQRWTGDHRTIFEFYRELIRLRRECAPLAQLSRKDMQIAACGEEQVLAVTRSAGGRQVLCLFNFSDQYRVISPPLADGTLQLILDSTGSTRPGSRLVIPETLPGLPPYGVMVFEKE